MPFRTWEEMRPNKRWPEYGDCEGYLDEIYKDPCYPGIPEGYERCSGCFQPAKLGTGTGMCAKCRNKSRSMRTP